MLVTGAAGFIGFHLAKRLLAEGNQVVGVDSVNDYYDVSLKEARLAILKESRSFTFHKLNLVHGEQVSEIFSQYKFEYVVHLAAQAGVRYSLTHPHAYIDSNITSFINILEGCKKNGIQHLMYASSSSVYGANTAMPFSVSQNVDHPVSLYAATKKANELIAHSYSVNFKLPTTGLRFFTVYGPWGRPDMALFLFTKAILEDKPIDVFNHGEMRRDFTYVEDIVEGIYRLIPTVPKPDQNWNSDDPIPSSSFAPFSLFNIGNNSPVDLMQFVEAIETEIGKKATVNYMPIQKGDVPATFADVSALTEAVGYKPNTTIQEGIANFVHWYREFYKK
ncbi:MAG: NAD-dependent epimerase [Cyclobacteriaceae bacterium]|nr:NAD-dependent epimerase [Cyclobacteriaceae bacterium HetDA_MAG_MS6]